MKKFAVKYQEILSRTFIVEAESYEQAEEKLKTEITDKGTIVLDYDDYTDNDYLPIEQFGKEPIPENANIEYFDELNDYIKVEDDEEEEWEE